MTKPCGTMIRSAKRGAMGGWEQEFRKIRLLVYAIFGSAVPAAAAIVFLDLPPLGEDALALPLEYILLACGISTTVVGLVAGKLMLAPDRLRRAMDRQAGDPPAYGARTEQALLSAVRNGLLVMAASGESCALLGLSSYIVTRIQWSAWVLVGLGAANFIVTQLGIEAARHDAETLRAESEPRTARARAT